MLPQGRWSRRVRLPIQANAPITYRSQRRFIDDRFSVHVSIPWWPDAVSYFSALARPPHDGSVGSPRVFVSSSEEARDGGYVEVSLAAGAVSAGEVLDGALTNRPEVLAAYRHGWCVGFARVYCYVA